MPRLTNTSTVLRSRPPSTTVPSCPNRSNSSCCLCVSSGMPATTSGLSAPKGGNEIFEVERASRHIIHAHLEVSVSPRSVGVHRYIASVALSDLTRESVLQAMAEYDELGVDEFLSR